LMLQADQYAPETEVHKYLHSRLASFDIATLYELHYQMITLGKVGPSPVKAATPLSCPSTFFVFAHFALFKPETSISIQKHPFCSGQLNSETPGDSKTVFLHWGDVPFHAYDGRLEYAHVVSSDTHARLHARTHAYTHRSLSSQPTSPWLSVANAFAGGSALSTLSVVMLHLGLDAMCEILHILVITRRLLIA